MIPDSFRLPVLLLAGLALGACREAGPRRADAGSSAGDSLLVLLRGIQEKNDFIAAQMGWRKPPDTSFKDIPEGTSFTAGAARPTLTLVVFSDMECPYCADFTRTADSLLARYPDEVRLVYKHFPLSFHANARGAAAAAMAAGRQGKFFEFQSRLAPDHARLGDSAYLAAARDLGLDLSRFRADMALDKEDEAVLDKDLAYGLSIGVGGTPTIFANGRISEGRSYRHFVKLLERARPKA